MWFFSYEDEEGHRTLSLPYFEEKDVKMGQREIDNAGLYVKPCFFVPESWVVALLCKSQE